MENLKGFRDFFPDPLPSKNDWSMEVRNWVFESWRKNARNYGFHEYDGPPLEYTELYTKKSGDEIVGQLYNFVDKGDREVSMRPEMTPTLARMVSRSANQYKKPMKWFSLPQLFRFEKNQRGRLREHFQLNADVIGESSPAADAELIALLIDSLRSLGLTDKEFFIRLSSRTAWQKFYEDNGGKAEFEYEFFQCIDKMEREDRGQTEEKLSKFGISIESVDKFIENAEPIGELVDIAQDLSDRGLGSYFKIDYRIIRGLAYYTGTVFEAFDTSKKFRAIAGGGRYDKLISLISGGKVDLPAIGFGMGDVVIIELLKSLGKLPGELSQPDVYFSIEDENLRSQSLSEIQFFRDQNLQVVFPLTKLNPNKQFKAALESKSKYLVLIDPMNQETLTVKNLNTKEKSTGTREEVVKFIHSNNNT